MIEITYRSDPGRPAATRQPRDADEALAWLDEGNRRFASLGEPGGEGRGEESSLVIDADFGFGAASGLAPEQRPFGIVLGCADARVPIEMIFGRAVNDLFVVRIAGGTIGSDAIGSIDYAVHHFPSVRIAVVLGHSQCGAVGAAVDAFLAPRVFLDLATSMPLRSLLDRILTGVRAASKALEEIHGAAVAGAAGYREALLEIAVAVNTAYTAFNLRAELERAVGSRVQVACGVYDLATRRAGVPGPEPGPLGPPPADAAGFRVLATSLAGARKVRDLLGG